MEQDTREIRTTALPSLDTGMIWGTKQLGIFVVVSQRPAQWRGEDVDVYAHIDTWYTIRPATEAEIAIWNLAVDAATARREQRKQLTGSAWGNNPSWKFDAVSGRYITTMTKLDSYDDRWNPPEPIQLTPEQVEIELAYERCFAALSGHSTQEG